MSISAYACAAQYRKIRELFNRQGLLLQEGTNLVLKRIFCIFAVGMILATSAVIAEDKTGFTADRHKGRNLACGACHGGEAQPKTAASAEACLTCHKSLEAVAERTTGFVQNPHDNHLTQSTDLECTVCHHGHKADTIACEQCHSGFKFEKSQPEAKPDAAKQ